MKKSSQYLRVFAGTLLLATQSGCGDPLKFGQELEDERVLGVRVISGENGEVALRPGQEAKFSVLLAGPEGPFEVRLGFEICQAEESDRGVPMCAESYVTGTTGLTALPELVATPPSTAAPGSPVAVLGVACRTGEPVLAADPLEWECLNGGEALNLSFDAEIQGSGRTNHVPDFGDLSVQFGGERVQLEAVDVPAHCDAEVLHFAKEETVPVEMVFGEAIREAYVDELDGPTLETIQVSHFATAGKFERQFSIIEPDQDALTLLDWVAPATAGPVKAYLVVRDGFGGVNWASLSLCVD